MIENINNINLFFLNYFNSFGDYKVIEQIVYIFADAPIFFLPVFLIGYWLYYNFGNFSQAYKNEKKQNLLFILYGTIVALSISLVIQQFIIIDRPENHLINSSKLLLQHIPDASFPSDHATVSFAFITGLFFSNYKKIAFFFLPIVIVMNISRVIAGVHWPFDIIAGAIIGYIGTFLVFKLGKINKFVKKINLWIIKIASILKL